LPARPRPRPAAITLWSRLHGLVSLEIEGNFTSTSLDPGTLYDTITGER
jgi:hypothetical protein